ncbi:MAG: hypothetical protein ACYTBP_04085 [Planctomycetota bacterium]|jgi:hypothetical protein
MNKSQLIVLWIGALVFLFCLWNPEIVPNTRYEKRMKELTDKEWERELSKYNLSFSDSKESLKERLLNYKNKKPKGGRPSLEDIRNLEGEYIKMLIKGERPSRMVEVANTYFTQPFETGSDALFVRLLSVTVLTALLVYSYSNKNRATLKAILQPFIQFKSKRGNKPKDEQKQ